MNARSPDGEPPPGAPTGAGDVPLPADGPDQEQSAGAEPPGSGPTDLGPEVVHDQRPWTVVALVLLAIFLVILAYALVLPALR
jgi:hypothetical protein